MKRIRDAVVNVIHKHAGNDEQLILELDQIVQETGENLTYSIFFNILTHLDLKPEIAQACWRQILTHRQDMGHKLGREVNLRTVICDYFCSIDKTFKNPVVVEIHVFENHLNSLKFDSLTGLYTRTTMEETLRREISRARRYENDLSVLFLDIDNFKTVNDSFGHLAGDMVLKEISRITMEEIRGEDAAARYGGEEIVLVLPDTGKVEGLILGERIRRKVESMNLIYEGREIFVTLSGGLATFPIDAQNAIHLLKCADSALYRAKESGKNTVSVYSHDKRRYLRVNFFSPIHVQQLGFADPIVDLYGQGKNISVAGILFESPTVIEIGTKVQLQISLNEKEGPLWIIGTIVRVESLDSDRYDIGVAFLELDKTAKNEISRYMIRQLERVV